MAEPTREQVFALAAQHCDQTVCNRERAVQGWNFSKDGLLDFVRVARELEATPEEAERARWDAHIRMERQAYARRDPNAETGDGATAVPDHIVRDVEQCESADRWNDGVPFKSRWERKLYESGFAAGWDRARAIDAERNSGEEQSA